MFHFKSPPQAANKLNSRQAKAALTHYEELAPHPPSIASTNKLGALKGKADRPNELGLYGSVYSPSAYNTKANNDSISSIVDTHPTNVIELVKRTDTLHPHPPDSPRISSRPGSGRLRSRQGSRASNHSNKPTPESSGTGEELSKALRKNPIEFGHNRFNGNVLTAENSPSSSGSESHLSAQLAQRNEHALQKILRREEDLEGSYALLLQPASL